MCNSIKGKKVDEILTLLKQMGPLSLMSARFSPRNLARELRWTNNRHKPAVNTGSATATWIPPPFKDYSIGLPLIAVRIAVLLSTSSAIPLLDEEHFWYNEREKNKKQTTKTHMYYPALCTYEIRRLLQQKGIKLQCWCSVSLRVYRVVIKRSTFCVRELLCCKGRKNISAHFNQASMDCINKLW